jgi:hypothetical protein
MPGAEPFAQCGESLVEQRARRVGVRQAEIVGDGREVQFEHQAAVHEFAARRAERPQRAFEAGSSSCPASKCWIGPCRTPGKGRDDVQRIRDAVRARVEDFARARGWASDTG